MRRLLTSFYLCCVVTLSIAQDHCHYYMAYHLDQEEEIITKNIFEEQLHQYQNTVLLNRTHQIMYKIPVIVHIIHNGETVGEGANINAEQVHAQIAVLNEDFQLENSSLDFIREDFKGLAGNAKIEFVLATKDPKGRVLEERGILRYNGGLPSWKSHQLAEFIKPTTIFDPYRYLNIWTVNYTDSYLLGEAQWPSGVVEGLADTQPVETDGIVIGYPFFGSREKYPDGNYSDLGYNLGRIATHEVGHWLGLRHTFEGCQHGDYVEDTPSQTFSSHGCPDDFQYSCGNLDLWENFMDYTDDGCKSLFTHGQVNRMHVVLEMDSMRRSVVTNSKETLALPSLAARMKIYPNPSHDQVNIDLSSFYRPEIGELRLFNAIGKQIWSTIPTEHILPLDVSKFTQGIYFLRYSRSTDGQSITKRIMIN